MTMREPLRPLTAIQKCFSRQSVMPPRPFRLFLLASFIYVSGEYNRVGTIARKIPYTIEFNHHRWELAARQAGYKSLYKLFLNQITLFAGTYSIEVILALSKGYCSYPGFGKNVKQLLKHHIFSILFLLSGLLGAIDMNQGDKDGTASKNSTFYNLIFCETAEETVGMSFISGIEILGIIETLLPIKYLKSRNLVRMATVGYIIPFSSIIGPKYVLKLIQLLQKEFQLAKAEKRQINTGFVGYSIMVIMLILGLYPSFAFRAMMRLRKMGTRFDMSL